MVANRQAAVQLAEGDLNRYDALTAGAISKQEVQQAQTANESATASYQQAIADRDLAKLNLDRTQVTASVNGIITNFDLRPGDYVTTGHPVTALVDTDSLRIDAYFEETRLRRIHIGDRIRIRLMGVGQPLTGHVESIAGGIVDRERQGVQSAGQHQPDLRLGASGTTHSSSDRPRRRPCGCAGDPWTDRDGGCGRTIKPLFRPAGRML